MKRTLLVVACLLPALTWAEEPADSCLNCHKDALSLKHLKAAEIAARLKDFAAGRADHPVPIPALSDAQIEALAKTLAGS
jgi:cytochrome c553